MKAEIDQSKSPKKHVGTRMNLSFPRDEDHFYNTEVKKINNRTDTFKDIEEESKSNNEMERIINLDNTLQREHNKQKVKNIISTTLVASPSKVHSKENSPRNNGRVNSGSDAKNARFGARHFKNRQPY